ncbi:MAG: hypothetical protein OXG30_17220 [bacterium]|nr:hypothetical protein [bacterium]
MRILYIDIDTLRADHGVLDETAILVSSDHGGRESLVLSQGAWSVQRGVRWGDNLYLRTWHDGCHAAWNEEMLFDIASDPHETDDLADQTPSVLAEGGPFHCKGHLPEYLERLEATGRSEAAAVLRQRHPVDDATTGLSGIPKDVLERLGVDT